MPSVEETTARINDLIEDEEAFRFDNGIFSIDLESTTCRVRVRRWNQGATIVHIVAPVLVDVPISDDLYRYVA